VSRPRRALAWSSLGAWAWAAAVALDDRRHLLELRTAEPAEDGRVSVIVPARNEAGRIAEALRSLERQTYPRLQVVLVDDESEDGTYDEARRHESERLTVLRGAPLPEGWVGKSWANHQGAAAAAGDWLLFTDADVVHDERAVALAVGLARRLGCAALTVLPRLETGSPAERIVQPAAAVLIRSFVAPGPLTRWHRVPTAIAAGGFILVRRSAYDAAGGHAAIRGRLVDDKALAERLKRTSGSVAIVDGGGLVRVRMYHGLAELWHGWRKNTSVGISERSPAVGVLAAALGAALAVGPWLALRGETRRLGAAGIALQVVARLEIERFAPTPPRYRLTLPLGCLFLAATSLASSVDRLRGGAVWRGRRYAT
jgi:hypothetical protein